MLACSFAPTDAITQLDILAASARLPSRDAERCKRLANTLRRPARVCLLGYRKAFITSVLRAVLDVPALSLGALPPALEVRFGPSLRTRATFEDGTTQTLEGWPGADRLQDAPVFLQIDLPTERLRVMSLLVLALEADPAMHRPALSWAAGKSEIAVWCTPSFDAAEVDIWASAPERLTQHAYLLEARPNPTRHRQLAVESFAQVFSPTAIEAQAVLPDVKPLLKRLTTDIAEARNADLDMVQLFLHRLGHLVPGVSPAAKPVDRDEGSRLGIRPASNLRPVLSEPMLYLMQRSRGLSETLAGSVAEDWPANILAHCAETVQALRERAESWPDDEPVVLSLQSLIDEICDAATLLEIEGRAEQAHDAAALLFQVRVAFERALGWGDA